MRTDVVTVAKNHNISHLGVVPFCLRAKRRSKKFGSLIDGFVIRLFSMAYDPKDASTKRIMLLNSSRMVVCDDKMIFKINILVPNVQCDASGAILAYIREALEQDRIARRSTIAGGNLEHDPSTIEAARKGGLMLLSKP